MWNNLYHVDCGHGFEILSFFGPVWYVFGSVWCVLGSVWCVLGSV